MIRFLRHHNIISAAMLAIGMAIFAFSTAGAQTMQSDSVSTGGSRLQLKVRNVNVGSISGDTLVRARFTLLNTGSDTVAIIRVHSDCGCTVPSYSRNPILPGDSAHVDVTYDPHGYRWGTFRRTLRIRTSAVETPYVTAVISGNIKKKYRK